MVANMKANPREIVKLLTFLAIENLKHPVSHATL